MTHQTVEKVDDGGPDGGMTYNVIDHLYYVPKVKKCHFLQLWV